MLFRIAPRYPLIAAALTLVGLTASARRSQAELIYGVTDTFDLVSFDSATPGNLSTIGALSGLVTGHTIRGIDFRPATGQLYALSTTTPNATAGTRAQIYTTDLLTGTLTALGTGFTLATNTGLNAIAAIELNPVDDTIRIVTGGNLNYRFDPTTGALIARDTNINTTGVITDIAYSNNVAGTTSTTLYAYNASTNTIGTIGSVGGTPSSPNNGQFDEIGSSGWLINDNGVGFDISGASNTAYISTNVTGAARDSLFRVNLGTGRMTNIGPLGANMLDISVRPGATVVPEPATVALMIPAVALGAAALRRRRRA